MPTETMPTVEICRVMISKFFIAKKPSTANENAVTIRITL